MTENRTKPTPVRLEDDLLRRIASYMISSGASNRSSAIRDLIELGLKYYSDQDLVSVQCDILSDVLIERVTESIERLYKVNSRGTKASLASLLLLSLYLPHIATMTKETGALVFDSADKSGLNVSITDLNIASMPLDDWLGITSAELFDLLWSSAGKIQRHGTKATYHAAMRDVAKKLHTDNLPKIELGKEGDEDGDPF